MSFRKAVRPTPLKIDFSSSGFYGEKCPICQINRLGINLEYPICIRCRQKYKLGKEFLNDLQHHGVFLNLDETQLHKEPLMASGTIDGLDWTAKPVMQKWQIDITANMSDSENRQRMAILRLLLTKIITGELPARRYLFIVTCGTFIVTSAYLYKRYLKQKAQEQKEAEEAER